MVSSSSGPRPCAASGSRPASARTASPAPEGWASSSPNGSSRGCLRSTSGRWTPAASAPQYADLDYTLARTVEVYSTYYDVKYPGHERQAGRPLKLSPTYERLSELGAAFGEKSGWERANWFEPNAAGWRRVAAPARLGREAVVAGNRRRAPRLPRVGGALRRDELCEDRGLRRRGRRLPRAPMREPRRPRGGTGHVHVDAERARRYRVRLHGHAARARNASASSRARHSASTTSPGSASTRLTTAPSRSRT